MYLAASFDTFPGDKGALTRLQSFRSGWLDDAAVGASAFSQTIAVFVSVPTISLALWLVRMKANAVAVILVLVPDGLNMALKWIVDRPRPDFSLVNPVPEGSSFPVDILCTRFCSSAYSCGSWENWSNLVS